MFSIYTSLYRLENGFIDWKSALDNFCSFADEVIVSTFLDNDMYTINELENYSKNNRKCTILRVFPGNIRDLDFDGRLKDAAFKICTQPYCILLDGDERINIQDKPKFEKIAKYLDDNKIDACFVPVIDLFNSEKEYKSIGCKWYISRNLSDLHRGIVNFAKKENGKIDINKSDTCELIKDNGQLAYSYYLINPSLADYEKLEVIKRDDLPVIYHLGWLDKEKRLKSNEFWQPVWNNRAGHEVKNIIHSKDKLDKIEYFPHGLKLWYE